MTTLNYVKNLEWSGESPEHPGQAACPSCRWRTKNGHREGCDMAALVGLVEEAQWRPIKEGEWFAPVLVSRPSDRVLYRPTSACMDVTGVWRVFRSKAGMTPLPFTPTHWRPLPAPPNSSEQNDA